MKVTKMTTKQVKAAAESTQAANIENGNSQKNTNGANSNGPSNLFISVKTFDTEGKTVGERIVDMYHFGTRNWLQNHHWWAMHNGHCVETNVATPDEIADFIVQSKQALAQKFQGQSAKAA